MFEQKQQSNAVKVSKRDGEKVRKILIEFKLLRSDLKPVKNESSVYFPIDYGVKIPSDLDVEYMEASFPLKSEPETEIKVALRELLPESLKEDLLPKIEFVGDIAILKPFDDCFSPFYKKIGELVLNRTRARSVFLKEGVIEGKFRLVKMLHLSGDPSPKTTHLEHGINISVNIQRAYFNPRLSTEHARISQLTQPGERVLDMFSGVGPFSLHIAKEKEVEVVALDLNPEAIKCLKESIQRNKLKGKIIPKTGDASDTVQELGRFDRVIMNLPEGANRFLNSAIKALKDTGTLHFYLFAKKIPTKDPVKQVVALVREKVTREGRTLKKVQGRILRDVSPSKCQVSVDAQIIPSDLK